MTPANANAFDLTTTLLIIPIVFIIHLRSAFPALKFVVVLFICCAAWLDLPLPQSPLFPEAEALEPSSGESITARLFPLTM
jgi:hypothetical protein